VKRFFEGVICQFSQAEDMLKFPAIPRIFLLAPHLVPLRSDMPLRHHAISASSQVHTWKEQKGGDIRDHYSR
jgi:hypothetical protein